MKILFLDIDGVLNSHQSTLYHLTNSTFFADKRIRQNARLCPIAISNLKYIAREVKDFKIVVSSTWRKVFPWTELVWILERQLFPTELLIGKTREDAKFGEPRGLQIQDWLNHNRALLGVEQFAIVDDDQDMVHLKGHLVKTDHRIGMTIIDADRIINILKNISGAIPCE